MLTLETLWFFTKIYTTKPYSFLVVGATLVSDNSLCSKKTINEKLLHHINKEAAKISALSSGNIDTDKTTIASLFSRHVLNEEVIYKLK